MDDDDEPMDQVMNHYTLESDDESGPASPSAGPGTPKLDDGPELESPNAKRSRLSRITAMQNLCKLEKLKSRNDVREIIRQLDKYRKFDIKTADRQRKRMERYDNSILE